MSRNYDNSQDSKHVVDVLSSYIDNALSSGERESVRAHLETCDPCRIEHDGLIGMKTMLQNLPVVPPPRSFTLTPELAGIGARQESFWQRLLTPRAVPRFATGSVVAFALLAMLLVGDLAGVRQIATNTPYAATSSESAPESAGLAQNNDAGMRGSPTDDPQRNAYLVPPAAGATVTTGAASGGQADTITGNISHAEATPATLAMGSAPESSPTVSVQDAFVAKQSAPSSGSDLYYVPTENGGVDALPAIELILAAIGTLLAIGALVARRRGI